MRRRTRQRDPVRQPLDHPAQVLRRGAAAAADQTEPELADELLQGVGQLDRLQRIVRAVGGELRQAGVGHQLTPDRGVAGQVPQVLAHLGRSGGAVQADQVDPERLERGQRRADLRAEQHRAGGLHRDVGDDRQVAAGRGQRPLGAQGGRPGLQQVLGGLDQDRVDAAAQQARDLLLVGVAQGGEADVAEGGQLGAGADAAEHAARPVGRAVPVGGLPGDPGGGGGQLEDPVGDAVLPERGQVGAEGVGLDSVDAGVEVGGVDGPDHVGPGDVEDLVAALEPLEVGQDGSWACSIVPMAPSAMTTRWDRAERRSCGN